MPKAECVEEVLPRECLLKDLGINLNEPVNIFEESSGASTLAKNGRFFENSKHRDKRYILLMIMLTRELKVLIK